MSLIARGRNVNDLYTPSTGLASIAAFGILASTESLWTSLRNGEPIQYYRGNPEELLRIRESKIERARNMKERKGGETAGTAS